MNMDIDVIQPTSSAATVIEDVYGNVKSKAISGTLTRDKLLNDAMMAAKMDDVEPVFTVRGRFLDGSK